MKNQGRLAVWLLCCASACAGGQTGEPTSGPALVCDANAVTGRAAEDLFARFEGTYEGLGVHSTSDEQCPAGGPIGIRVVVARSDEVSVADRPCGTHYVAVSVTVSSDDGELDSTVDGWLGEEGQLRLSEGTVRLNLDERSAVVDGLGDVRGIEACCVEPLSETSVAVLADLGATELLDFDYWYSDRTQHQTRLVLSLAPAEPLDSCGTVDTAFEVRNADGELAGSGSATVTYSACQVPSCLSLLVTGSGVVESESALLGNEDFPGALTELDVTYSGQSQDGALIVNTLGFETFGDGPIGAALELRR